MSLHVPSRYSIAVLLSLIAAISAAQTGIVTNPVSADSTVNFTLSTAPTSTEPISANGNVEVNVQSGELKVQLHQATPDSTYQVLFVGGSNIQLGTFSTDAGGEGSLGATLTSGAYAGLFQVIRSNLIQFVSANISFTIGSTQQSTTTSTTASSTSVSSSTTNSTEVSPNVTSSQVYVKVDPILQVVNAGAVAKYEIQIKVHDSAGVVLAAKGVPPLSVAIFTQERGNADPEFHSTLTVLTSVNTPPATYGLTLISMINGVEYDSDMGMEVNGATTTITTTNSQPTSSVGGLSLGVTVSTDQQHYDANSTVNLQAHVTDSSGNVVSDATVSLQVDGPTGTEIIFLTSLSTDSAGAIQTSFKLPASAIPGTYTAFITASKSSYTSATTHTTFVVGASLTPGVVISEVYTTDTSGTRATVFSRGQTVVVWVVIENSGATFQGVIWVQIVDPNGIPVSIQFQISPLGSGQTVRVGIGLTLAPSLTLGVYKADALVSDKLISQGGTFFASQNAEFAVTG